MIRHDWEIPLFLAIVAWGLYGWVGVLMLALVGGSWLLGLWSVLRTWRALRAERTDRILSWSR